MYKTNRTYYYPNEFRGGYMSMTLNDVVIEENFDNNQEMHYEKLGDGTVRVVGPGWIRRNDELVKEKEENEHEND